MENPISLSVVKGTTSKRFQFFIGDSSVTSGAGLTGLTNISGSLVCYYIRDGDASATNISLNSATVGTFTSGGFKEISSSNTPGLYEFGIPNACLATGADFCTIMLKGAANMRPTIINIELTSVNKQDSVRGGMTALPNAAAAAAGGLIILGSNNTAAITIGALTTGAISATTLATSGAATFNSLVVSTTTTFTGAITAQNVTVGGTMTYTGHVLYSDGVEIYIPTTLNRDGLIIYGQGTGNAIKVTAGDNGADAIFITTGILGGNAVQLYVAGGDGNGLAITGSGTGYDVLLNGTGTIHGKIDRCTLLDSLSAGAITATSIAADAITAAKVAADVGVEIGTAVWATTTRQITATQAFSNTGTWTGNIVGTLSTLTTYTGNTPQTGDAYAIVNSATFGNAKLVRSTTPANTLDVSATGEAGLDWANMGGKTTTNNLTNTTVHLVDLVTTVTNNPNAGNGAYTITATVTDGTNPLSQATVRVTAGINTFSTVSDGSGLVNFSLDAGTYTVSATKGGYTFTPSSRTVTGNNAGTLYSTPIALTAVVVPVAPTDPSLCTVYGHCRNQATNALMPNVEIIATREPGGLAYAGGALVGREIRTRTDVNGLYQLNVTRTDYITKPTNAKWGITCKSAGINVAPRAFTTTTYNLDTLLNT
jgi:hypothetical protein